MDDRVDKFSEVKGAISSRARHETPATQDEMRQLT